MTGSRNFGLDMVRMFAILPVMAEHFLMIAMKTPPSWLWPAGSFGVGIFFVLSGFLIGGIILRQFDPAMSRAEVRTFYIRRWMRTLPLYWVFFVASMFFTIFGLRLDPEFGAKCLSYVLFLQNLAWPLPAQWYQESWSLAVEEWFYLLFPAIFLVLPFRTTRARVFGVAVVMTVLPLIIRAVIYARTGNAATATQGIVALKLDGIAIGIFAVLVLARLQLVIARNRGFLCIVGVFGGLICYVIPLQVFGSFPAFQATLLPILTSVCVAAAMLGAQAYDWHSIRENISGAAVTWISTRSYSLYLCHGSIIKMMLGKGYMWKGLSVSVPMFIIASIVIAELAHQLIEKPFMRIRPREQQRRTESQAPLAEA